MTAKRNFFLLNTNNKYRLADQVEMLGCGFAEAYCENKHKINEICKGDIVFLYGNKQGIVGYGKGSGLVLSKDRRRPDGDQFVKNGCHFQQLTDFRVVQPLPAKRIQEILERKLYFAQTLVPLPDGQKLLNILSRRT